jgi:hypothetical protein
MRKSRRQGPWHGNSNARRRNAKLWRMIRAGKIKPMTKAEMRDAIAKL